MNSQFQMFDNIRPFKNGVIKHEKELYEFQKNNPQTNMFVLIDYMSPQTKEKMLELTEKDSRYAKTYNLALEHKEKSELKDDTCLDEDFAEIIHYNRKWMECFTSINPHWKKRFMQE